MNDSDFRAQRAKRVTPSRTANMSAAQATTDAYAAVAESKITTTHHDKVGFVVEETGATNAVDAKITGRLKDSQGNFGPWVDAPGANASAAAIAAGASAHLYPDDCALDQMRVEVKANVAGSQGSVKVYGLSRATEF